MGYLQDYLEIWGLSPEEKREQIYRDKIKTAKFVFGGLGFVIGLLMGIFIQRIYM